MKITSYGIVRRAWLVVSLAIAAEGFAQSIVTFAGGASLDGRPATATPLIEPTSIVVSASGEILISELYRARVRKVTTNGSIVTLAGTGDAAGIGDETADNGPATLARLSRDLNGIAVDGDGNVYIADSYRIRVVDRDGIIRTFASFSEGVKVHVRPSDIATNGKALFIGGTDQRIYKIDLETSALSVIAGNGTPGFSGDGGPATAAQFSGISFLAPDPEGNLYFADTFNHRVRYVDATTGFIRTIAGNGTAPQVSFAFQDHAPALTTAIPFPRDVALSSDDELMILTDDDLVLRLDRSKNTLLRVAGGGFCTGSYSQCADRGDGGSARDANLASPRAISFDAGGRLYIATRGTGRVRRVDLHTGIITTVAGNGNAAVGDGGPATGTILHLPRKLALDSRGNLFIADNFGHRVKMVRIRDRTIETVVGNGLNTFDDPSPGQDPRTLGSYGPVDVAVCRNGFIYVLSSTGRILRFDESLREAVIITSGREFGFAGDGGPAIQASFRRPNALECEASGNLLVADSGNGRIRRIDVATGRIQTIAGTSAPPSDELCTHGPDGLPATATALCSPANIAVDSKGSIYFSESGLSSANRLYSYIRRIEADGTIVRVAGSDALDLRDSEFRNHRRDGDPGLETLLYEVYDIAFDANDNLLVSDGFGIRSIDRATGTVHTIIGTFRIDGVAYLGDDGPATATQRGASAYGLAVSTDGTLFVSHNDRVRWVRPCVPLIPPLLESPSNGSSGLSASPRLEWAATQGAFRYDLYLSDGPAAAAVAAADLTATSFSPANLEPLTTYYWRVTAKGDPFCSPARSAASETRSFATESTCQAPARFE